MILALVDPIGDCGILLDATVLVFLDDVAVFLVHGLHLRDSVFKDFLSHIPDRGVFALLLDTLKCMPYGRIRLSIAGALMACNVLVLHCGIQDIIEGHHSEIQVFWDFPKAFIVHEALYAELPGKLSRHAAPVLVLHLLAPQYGIVYVGYDRENELAIWNYSEKAEHGLVAYPFWDILNLPDLLDIPFGRFGYTYIYQKGYQVDHSCLYNGISEVGDQDD